MSQKNIFDNIGRAPMHPIALTVGGFTMALDPARLFGLREKKSGVLDDTSHGTID